MVEGVAALKAELQTRLTGRIRVAAKSAMEQGADELVKMMKSLVPVSSDGSHGKAPGTLRNSIGWTWGKAPKGSRVITKSGPNDTNAPVITIYAGNDEAFYAAWQEFGRVGMAAQGYFFPSWRALRTRIRSRISRNVNKAIKAGAV